MAGKLVEVKDVYKSFGEQSVLAGVSLEVNETQNLVIFGKSGTGKSVLLKCMVGLLTPDKGTISINGIDVLNIPLKEMN